MLKSISFLILLCSVLCVHSQSKKDIKKNHVSSVTITETAGDKIINDEKTIYDAKGKVIEKIEYHKDGLLKKTVKSKRNTLGNVIEEQEYDENNNLKETTLVKYNAFNDKSEEWIYDADKKLVKKHIYTYDNKGLKIERKTLDAGDKLISTKKYAYTYK